MEASPASCSNFGQLPTKDNKDMEFMLTLCGIVTTLGPHLQAGHPRLQRPIILRRE